MDEERARILKLLEEGKITAQEAEKLLLALKGSGRPDMSRDELRMRMRRHGLREMRNMPEMVHEAIAEAWGDGLTAAVRKQKLVFESKGRVLVRNVSGDTNVEGWDKPTVAFDREEGGLWKANEREGMIMAKVLSGDIHVMVPRKSTLEVNSVSGDIGIRDTSGRIDVKSVSGDIDLARMSSTLDVNTTSGDIRTRDIDGKCHITTVSGDVDLGFRATLSGTVETKTGDIAVHVPADANLLLEVEIMIDGEINSAVAAPCEQILNEPRHVKLGFGAKEDRLWIRCREGDVEIDSYEAGKPVEAPAAEEAAKE